MNHRHFRAWALLLMGLGWLTLSAKAQELTITATAEPIQGQVGQNIRLIVTVEGRANIQSDPELPSMEAFQVYNGGRSSNFAFINGQVSSSLSFTYILVPKQTGTFTIGPVGITHNNQRYQTAPITVTVSAAGGQAVPRSQAPSRSYQGALPPDEVPSAGEQDAIFITTEVNKRQVFVNQPVTLSFKFFSRIPILAQPQYVPPVANGFWAEDLPPQREYQTVINGQEYRVIEIKTALFPTSSGDLTISPARLTIQVQNFQRRMRDPFYDSFFNSFFQTGQPITLESKPITVRVLPLPTSGQPAKFSGAVGDWSLSARLDRKEAQVGDAVTLEVRIFGEGNVKSVGKPELPELTGFKVYDTVSSSEVQKENDRVRGVKIFRTLLRPQVTGKLTIPAISTIFFNPQTKTYESNQVPALTLDVLPGPAGSVSAGAATAPGPLGNVQVIAQDIRYLKIRASLAPSPRPWPAWIWVAGFALPLMIVAGIWGYRTYQNQLLADPILARRMKANPTAMKVLRMARVARLSKDPKRFYTNIIQAINGYLADQLMLSRAGATQRELMLRLETAGLPGRERERLAKLWQEADFARFAPTEQAPEAMAEHEKEAEQLLTELIRFLSKEKS